MPELALRLVTYRDSDDVLLVWRTSVDGVLDRPIPDCLGFMLERQRRNPDGSFGASFVLPNRVGFDDAPPPQPAGSPEGAPETRSQPSSLWPFQRFDWTDHGASERDVLRYRVSAMRLPPGGTPGKTPLVPIVSSDWSGPVQVSGAGADGVSAFFNRGFVMSQYVARIAREHGWKAQDIKAHVKDLEEPLRRWVSGDLRLKLLALVDEAIDDPSLSLYAALFELDDRELVERLKLLRGRAHLVLSNGADKGGDENADVRKELDRADVGVDVHDRLLGSKGLGHNKFAVLVRGKGDARKVWTGSTNWTTTGLCTQLNNGILFDDPAVAAIYLAQWKNLADAGSSFPQTLVAANAASPRSAGKTDVWFTRVRNRSTKNVGVGKDLQALVDVVNGARQAILYVMFQPGPEPLESILKKMEGGLYVRGVVSTVSSVVEEKFRLAGIDTGAGEYKTDLVQPQGVKKDFAWWVAEVTRAQFLPSKYGGGIGFAITHAKMIVIDPFDPVRCAVVTGSHNFSASASEENDENFVVVRGNPALAQVYATACYATYGHYRWRAYLEDKQAKGETPWSHLGKTPAWQDDQFTAREKKHLGIWCP